jgi:hypothetical protein
MAISDSTKHKRDIARGSGFEVNRGCHPAPRRPGWAPAMRRCMPLQIRNTSPSPCSLGRSDATRRKYSSRRSCCDRAGEGPDDLQLLAAQLEWHPTVFFLVRDRRVSTRVASGPCAHDTRQARAAQTNVRFGSLCGLKSDISPSPRSATSCREQMQQPAWANDRVIRSPRRRVRAASVALRGQAPWRS